MRYRRLGRTGLQVSELSLGAARGASTDPEGFKTTVHAVIDAGINLIDTAESYENGVSESVLGEALVGRRRRPRGDQVPAVRQPRSGCQLHRLAGAAGRVGRGEPAPPAPRPHRHPVGAWHPQPGNARPLHERRLLRGDGQAARAGQGALHRHQRAVGGGRDASGAAARRAQRGVRRGDADAQLPAADRRRRGAAAVPPARCRHGGDDAAEPGVQSVGAGQRAGRAGVRATPHRRRESARRAALHRSGAVRLPAALSIPEAGLRYVLAHDVSTCCVGMQSPQRLQENLRAVDPPYLDPATLARLRELFGRIQMQVR